MEILSFLRALSDYGISGIVAAIAIAFAWYQTKRIETLTDRMLKDALDFGRTVAELLRVNKNEEVTGTENRGSLLTPARLEAASNEVAEKGTPEAPSR